MLKKISDSIIGNTGKWYSSNWKERLDQLISKRHNIDAEWYQEQIDTRHPMRNLPYNPEIFQYQIDNWMDEGGEKRVIAGLIENYNNLIIDWNEMWQKNEGLKW